MIDHVPPAGAAEPLITVSLLRLGRDTSAVRAYKTLVEAGAETTPEYVAEVIGEPPESLERARCAARQALADTAVLGLRVLTVASSAYPERLRHIPDPPTALWLDGGAAVLDTPSVAVVGSRYPTAAGLATARRLSRELAQAGFTIVSGLARGIDGAAHRGAIDAAGWTVAVLGNGSDVVYPAEHRELHAAIKREGAVVTEFPPGTRPHARHFPLRNRIISGLSQAVVVVEAAEKSGSLITARAALEQGRDVLAVPGGVASGHYRGCHALIKDGARLVETVDDILEELIGPAGLLEISRKRSTNKKLDRILTWGEAVTVDEIAERTGRPAAEWLRELAVLEIEGAVGRVPGGGFVRLDEPATYIKGQATEGRRETGSRHAEGSGRRRIAGEGEDD